MRLPPKGRARRPRWLGWALVLGLAAVAAGLGMYLSFRPQTARLGRLRAFRSDPAAHADWSIRAGDRCGEAPFLFPTDGLVGFLWGDSFRPGRRHQGLDIFGPDRLGETRVLAAYDGYLTRLPDWRSAVIVRIPDDPLHPGRQIWTYYTHMADALGSSFIDAAFPPGSTEVFVRAGTRLGYQGNYSADPMNPVGMHLHFSIVLDDGRGKFRNELEFANTLDPSPYLGFQVEASQAGDAPAVCPPTQTNVARPGGGG